MVIAVAMTTLYAWLAVGLLGMTKGSGKFWISGFSWAQGTNPSGPRPAYPLAWFLLPVSSTPAVPSWARVITPVRPATDRTSEAMPSILSQVVPSKAIRSPGFHWLIPSMEVANPGGVGDVGVVVARRGGRDRGTGEEVQDPRHGAAREGDLLAHEGRQGAGCGLVAGELGC
jgi:hypothetical protein